MAEQLKAGADAQIITDEQLRKAEEYVQQEEGAANRLSGWVGVTVTAIAVAMTLFHLYAAYDIVPTIPLRYTHVGFVLLLSFLLFPVSNRFRNRIQWFDVVPPLIGIATIIYALMQGDDFTDRAAVPEKWDVILGAIFIVLVLEAARRTTGWIMPLVAVCFILYAYFGPNLPPPWTHRGYDISRLVGHLFITLEGIFGVPIDVSATLIIMFTIYGAILQHSGAGKFFIDFSLAVMGGKPSSAGRAVVASSFLLGGPSGSGVATTVMIGTVAYPMLAKAGWTWRHHIAAGAGRRRVPDRGVSQDQLPRRDLDGDHPDMPLLPFPAVHGRTRLAALRRARGGVQAGDDRMGDDQAIRIPFRFAGRRRHLHGDRLFADAVCVLLNNPGFHHERARAGHDSRSA
jgi:hypothetical protein